MAAFVYMLRCKDGSLYTGWTNDLEHRLAMHNSGRGAKYTRGRGPLELVYSEELPDKEAALGRECAIKSCAGSRSSLCCRHGKLALQNKIIKIQTNICFSCTYRL